MLFNNKKMDIRTVTVIGANGTMGTNASAIFASFGCAKVYMISRDIQKSRNAIERAVKSVRADSIRNRLVPCDYSHIDKCIEESDLVFESVSEDLDTKKEIFKQIRNKLKKDCVVSTGTSGLSIKELADCLCLENRRLFFGLHFFNPPYSMPLLELVKTPYSNNNDILELKKYLENVLLRRVVIVNDSPAFLANRIGFEFINLSLQYAEKYKEYGGIDFIDSIIGKFTGRSMAPCATADFVGIDVHIAIIKNAFDKLNDSYKDNFAVPQFLVSLVEKGKLGLKTGSGLYKTIVDEMSGAKIKMVYDIKTCKYRPIKKYNFSFVNKINNCLEIGDYNGAFDVIRTNNSLECKICRRLLKEYVDYSLMVAEQVSESIYSADIAMAEGFNWCPPLALSDVLFDTNYKSSYDYRKFFKVDK